MSGKAVIHINGAKYQSAGQYTHKDSATFQNLVQRIEKMVKSDDAQVQQFDVVIEGHWGQLLVRPAAVVSAAIAYVPEG